jgi:endonuclease YncB( thermonuclease family)
MTNPPFSARRKPFRSRLRRLGDGLLVFIILAVAGGALLVFNGETISATPSQARAIDGDSLMLGQREIRLWGIDAPEMQQVCRAGGVEVACGRRARTRLADLLKGRDLECRGFGDDRYGRLLAVCRAAGADINRMLVIEGLAFDYGGYPVEEADARAGKRGVWAGEAERPRSFRDRNKAGLDEAAGLLDWIYQRLQALAVKQAGS